MSESPALEVKDLGHRYSGAACPTLEEVTFSLQPGRIGCLLGPSGSGKTTLLRMIAGFEPVHAGMIRVAGRAVAGPDLFIEPGQRGIGMVFQDYALFPHLTVRANICFGLRRGQELPQHMVDTMELGDLLGRRPHELSGGQQQRVALARALAPQPALLLLDEPFSNLDPDLLRSMVPELRQRLRDLGVTAFMFTHDPNTGFDLADEMGFLDRGRLKQWGPPRQLYERPASRAVALALGEGSFVPTDLQQPGCELPDACRKHRGYLFVRPAQVRLGTVRGEGPLVRQVSFRGSHTLVELEPASGLRLLALCSGAPPEPGSRIQVRLETDGEPVIFT